MLCDRALDLADHRQRGADTAAGARHENLAALIVGMLIAGSLTVLSGWSLMPFDLRVEDLHRSAKLQIVTQ